MSSRSAILVLALSVALSTCGGEDEPADIEPSSADERAILAVVESYELATAEGDAGLFCEEVLAGRRRGCEQLVAEAMEDPESDLSSAEQLTVLAFNITGDSAEVRVEDDGERYPVTFVKEDGGWRMQVFN